MPDSSDSSDTDTGGEFQITFFVKNHTRSELELTIILSE